MSSGYMGIWGGLTEVRGGGSTGGCLLFNFLLFSIKYVMYLMAIWCRCFMSIFTSVLGIFSFF